MDAKLFCDWAKTLSDNAPAAIGAQSQLTGGARQLIRGMIKCIEEMNNDGGSA